MEGIKIKILKKVNFRRLWGVLLGKKRRGSGNQVIRWWVSGKLGNQGVEIRKSEDCHGPSGLAMTNV
jgi:hypothetical protein